MKNNRTGWSLLFVLICVSLIVALFVEFSTQVKVDRKDFVTLSIIIEKADDFDTLSKWLDDVGYTNFTFAVRDVAEEYILGNLTRISKLKQYGKIIPEVSFIQVFSPSDRKEQIDIRINNWTQCVGYAPKGIMSFQPDAYTCQYLLQRNFTYVQGYCFDQYLIDYMTMRGGFQMPYYAHPSHALMPNNMSDFGLVILPHSTWDWIESFTTIHEMHLHPQNLVKIFNGTEAAKQYFIDLISRSIRASRPFGMAICQFEWSWCCRSDLTEDLKDWIKTLLANRDYDFWDFETIADWFKSNYRRTPTYKVEFMSPYSGKRIEWYYETRCRIARVANQVVSYVDYTRQSADKFLTQKGFFEYSLPWSESNVLDNSLDFEIDALGGGTHRAPVRTSPFDYTRNLTLFPAIYDANRKI